MSKALSLIEENVVSKIFVIRNKKVMLDSDLAALYGVETKNLKRQVKRNVSRFPEDFMFELTLEEVYNLRCQFGTSSLSNFLSKYKALGMVNNLWGHNKGENLFT